MKTPAAVAVPPPLPQMVLNVGSRPTVNKGDEAPSLECHILHHFEGGQEFYGSELEVRGRTTAGEGGLGYRRRNPGRPKGQNSNQSKNGGRWGRCYARLAYSPGRPAQRGSGVGGRG